MYPIHRLELLLNKHSFQLSVLYPSGVPRAPAVCVNTSWCGRECQDERYMPDLVMHFATLTAGFHNSMITEDTLDGFPAS